MDEQINIGEFLVIAERVLEIDAKSLTGATRLGDAESALAAPFAGFGDVLFYPDLSPSRRGDWGTDRG